MGLARVLLRRRGVGDDRAQDDDGRLVRDLLALFDRLEQRVDVLGVLAAVLRAGAPVDDAHVPAVRLVTLGDVLGEGDVRVVLDRDVVLVIDEGQVAELLVTGEGAGLGRHTLHDVAVGGDDVDVVVERRLAGRRLGVVQTLLTALRHRHADGGGEARAERARRDVDALGVVHLGVAGGLRTPRAKRLQVVELEARTGQVQLDVLRQRRVTAGQDETVTADPLGVGGVVRHEVLVDEVGDGCQAHRGAGVAVADLLDSVGGQQAGRVDGPDVDVAPAGLVSLRQGECVGTLGGGLIRGHGSGSFVSESNSRRA